MIRAGTEVLSNKFPGTEACMDFSFSDEHPRYAQMMDKPVTPEHDGV
jgi:hypothetical protein